MRTQIAMPTTLALTLFACLAPQSDPVQQAQARAIEYLIEQQLPDGTWPLPGNERFTHAGAAFLGFALVRAGLPTDHLAIWRVDELLRRHQPRSTYDASVRIHFLDAVRPPDLHQRLGRAAAKLALPRADYFGYGYTPTIPHGDLSNHQFALLALEILNRHEMGPDRQEWTQLSELLLKLQRPDGGWGYFLHTDSTPTMHLAGLACLAACEQALLRQKAKRSLLLSVTEALDRGFESAGKNWYLKVDRTRAPLKRWIHYAGATLERACSLSGRNMVGEHDWYQEISSLLVEAQHARGSWSSGSGEPVLNTGLALATLARASSATGSGSNPTWRPLWSSEHGAARLVASGQKPCTAFVSSLQGEWDEWELTSALWFLDEEALGKGAGPRGTIQFALPKNGELRLRAHLEILDPVHGDTHEIEQELTLHVRGMVDGAAYSEPGWDQTVPAHGESSYEILSTSECVGGPAGAGWVSDGSWATSWRWKGNSPPELKIEWEEGMRSQGIRLIPHLTTTDARPTRAPALELRVNGARRRIEPVIDSAGVYYPLPRVTKIRTLYLQWKAPPQDLPEGWLGIREIQLIAP